MGKRILVLGNSAAGVYNFRGELLLAFAAEGWEVTVAVPYAEHVEDIRALGCAYEETPMERRGTNPIRDLGLYRLYRRIMKRLRPDMVLTYTIKPNVYGGICAGRLHIPYLANITGLGSAFEKKGLLQRMVVLLYRMGLKRADCVFFQNEQNRKLFERKGIQGKESRLLHGSGVNLERFSVQPYPANEKPKLLYVGRIMKEKGMDEFLGCAQELAEQAEFQIIGYCEESYGDRIQRMQQEGKLHFYGYQKDVLPFLREADAVVMPSYHEGMSNVILEAAAAGRPALASNISGCREAFDDGVTGIGFEPGSEAALREAVERFLQLPLEKRAEMGRAARVKAEQEFDRAQIVGAYLAEIRRIWQ